jgi:molybdenum cofactor cytidylyltransferase
VQTAAVLLSGGASERFGGFPKALLAVGETTGVRRMSEMALGEGLDPVLVVVGSHAHQIEHEIRGLPVTHVVAEDWREGRTASLQAGLAALPEARDVLFWPVDHPFVRRSTLETLFAARAADPFAVWFTPTYEGRGGHPVLWRSEVRSHVAELRPDAPLRSLLPEFGPQVRRVRVDDPGVTENVDTPEAYHAALDRFLADGVG